MSRDPFPQWPRMRHDGAALDYAPGASVKRFSPRRFVIAMTVLNGLLTAWATLLFLAWLALS